MTVGGQCHGDREFENLVQAISIVRTCRCATLWCDLDLTFELAVVTLTYKILSGLYLRYRKV